MTKTNLQHGLPGQSGWIGRLAVCNRSGLAASRRHVCATLLTAPGPLALPSARADVYVVIGPDEWNPWAATVRAQRPRMTTPGPFAHLEATLSEAVARHSDADPACIVIALLPVSADPGPDPVQELIEVQL